VHAVTARVKTTQSLRGKLREKKYKRPRSQITDFIGVRVITYYRDDVDKVVPILQAAFETHSTASVDKRVKLGLRTFGYRSVHVIARLKDVTTGWFEIQVRSILEHAWAEIEHEIVYKSGINQPQEIVRRFASLAGTLELLDNEFQELRHERNVLIGVYWDRYSQNEDASKPFDVARLLGFLEADRSGLGWRDAEAAGKPFAAGLDVSCVEALKSAGLGTAKSLRKIFRSSRFRYALRSFASSNGISPSEVSHLAAVVLAVIVKRPQLVRQHFPEMMFDETARDIVERRCRKR